MKQLHPVGLAIRFARFSAASIPSSRSSRMLLSCSALLLGTFVQSASHKVNAGLITFYYEAKIDSIDSGLDTSGFFQSGDTVSGSYTFESTTVDASSDVGQGNYFAISSIEFSVGSYSGSASDGVISVVDNYNGSGDRYDAASNGSVLAGPVDGRSLLFFSLVLDTNDPASAGVFSSDELPLTPPDINAFATKQFLMTFREQGTPLARVSGTLTSLSDVAPSSSGVVPEPSSCLIFAMGICGLVVRRRRS